MKIIAQCGRCHNQIELKKEPSELLRCKCGGARSVYKTTTLSPVELEAKYGRPNLNGQKIDENTIAPKNQNGEPINPPVIIQDRKREEKKYMSTQPKNGQPVKSNAPDKIEVLKEIAAGISVSKLEKKWKMGQGALVYYIYKWGWKGIKPDRAQQLLDEMAIDNPEPVLREKDVAKSDPAVSSPDVAKLQQKLSDAIGERNQFRDLYSNVETENEKLKAAMKGATVIANQAGARVKELEEGAKTANKLIIDYATENAELRKELESRNIEHQDVVEAHIVAPVRSRQIRIESKGDPNTIEDELLAILAYVQAMRGQHLRLELYLGEVAH